MWVFPAIPLFFYIGSELIAPKHKWYIIIIVLVLCLAFVLLLVFDTANSFVFIYPEKSGENIIHAYFVLGSPASILWIIILIFSTIIVVRGFLITAIKSPKAVKRKYLILSIGYSIWLSIGMIDCFISMGNALIIIRIIAVSPFWFWYLGLMPKKVDKPKKRLPSKAELELASYMLGKPKSVENNQEHVLIRKNLKKEILVFISYATKDAELFNIQETADLLTNYEEIENILYWQEDLEDNIFKYISDNLGKCDVMVLFCSDNALNSVPIEKEWTAADALYKPIIPVIFDVKHIPPLLKSRLGLEFDFYNKQKNIQDLYALILKKCTSLTE